MKNIITGVLITGVAAILIWALILSAQ